MAILQSEDDVAVWVFFTQIFAESFKELHANLLHYLEVRSFGDLAGYLNGLLVVQIACFGPTNLTNFVLCDLLVKDMVKELRQVFLS